MRFAATCLILAGCLAISQHAAAGNGWRNLGGAGDRHFVVIDASAADIAAVYQDAASALCKAGRTCVVMFWNDERVAASKMPLSAEQAGSRVAQFTRSPATGSERLLFRCRGSEPAGSCLK